MNHITDNAETTASITVLGNYDVGNLDSTEIDSAVWDGTALTQLTIQGVEVDGAWTRWGYSFPFVVAAGKLPGLTVRFYMIIVLTLKEIDREKLACWWYEC